MKTIVIIEADTNDADYITEITEIKDTQIDFFKKVANAIKLQSKKYPYMCNWWAHNGHKAKGQVELKEMYKDFLSEEEIEDFSSCCPSNELGIHTIESIRILKVEDDIELLK